MKKTLIVTAVFFLTLLITMPIVPIGSNSTFVDLATGSEITQKSFFMDILFSQTVDNTTVLYSKWPKQNTNQPDMVLIAKTIIYPFSEKYIDFKVARMYYQLKNYYLEYPSSTDDGKIDSFIIYCKKNKLNKME